MSYISAESVKEIRNELKATFPQIKFSVVRDGSSSVDVTILSAPINLLNDPKRGDETVNHYYIKDHYTDPEVQKILLGINAIVSRNNKTVSHDADYGSIPNYYMHINIGKWNKPFCLSK